MSLLDDAKAASAEFDKKAVEIKKQEIEREIAYADQLLISKIREGEQFEYIVNNSKNDELSPPKFKATGETEMLHILEEHFKKEGFTTNVFERVTHWGESLTVLSVNLPGKAQQATTREFVFLAFQNTYLLQKNFSLEACFIVRILSARLRM